MTSTPPAEVPRRIAVLGTGLIGTSIALAAARAGIVVSGWDADPAVGERAATTGGLARSATLEDAVAEADLVVVSTPILAVAPTVAAALEAAPRAIVTDAGSIKARIAAQTATLVHGDGVGRFVPGHPMGGSERSGPEHASASVVDGIVWVLAPTDDTDPGSVATVDAFVRAIGARPLVLTPERHDRLVAFVSHLPQIASTTLMGLAATEEADEPDMLLLAAGGFRDLTRLASSNPALWTEILLANADQVAQAIDLYVERLERLRRDVLAGADADVERTFDDAKRARLRLSAKATVRSGVAILQVEIPDEPGALARITGVLSTGGVNIEDLQIVHSPEGGRGMVHLTVAATNATGAAEVLASNGYDPLRLA